MLKCKQLMNEVFPALEDNERITVIKMNDSGIQEKHYKTVNGAMRWAVNNEKYYRNVYYSVSTTDGLGRKTENLISRSCLVWDFDKKDLGQDFSHKDIVHKFRSINLFYHAIVDSGNGYHVYVMIEPTTDLDKVKAVTEAVAIRVGADMNATLKTQLIRFPGTVNIKDPANKKDVKVVYLDDEIKRKSIDTLASMYVTESVKRTNIGYLMRDDHTPQCVKDIVATGSSIGNRNSDLQRMIVALKRQRKSLAEIEAVIDEWLDTTEKLEDLEYQVKYIYENMYNGCLDCSSCPYKGECYVRDNDGDFIDDYPKIDIPNRDLAKIKNSRKNKGGAKFMNGNMLVIYGVLANHKKGLFKDEIIDELTYKGNRRETVENPKCCFSDKTIRDTLKKLEDNGFIEVISVNRKSFYRIKPNRVIEDLKIKISYGAVYECIKGRITTTELELYCYMKYLNHIKPKKRGDIPTAITVTQEQLARDLGITRERVTQMITHLLNEKYISINYRAKSSNNNFMYNSYLLNY